MQLKLLKAINSFALVHTAGYYCYLENVLHLFVLKARDLQRGGCNEMVQS